MFGTHTTSRLVSFKQLAQMIQDLLSHEPLKALMTTKHQNFKTTDVLTSVIKYSCFYYVLFQKLLL